MKNDYYDDNCGSDIEEERELVVPHAGIDQYLQAHQRQQPPIKVDIPEPVIIHVSSAQGNRAGGISQANKVLAIQNKLLSVSQGLGFIDLVKSTQNLSSGNPGACNLQVHKEYSSNVVYYMQADEPIKAGESSLIGENNVIE
jgi:hypothetical protein